MSFVNTTSQGYLKIAGGDVIAFYKSLSTLPIRALLANGYEKQNGGELRGDCSQT